jgi:hypothetical protein
MKFKVYGWIGINRDIHPAKGERFEDYRLSLIPGVDFSLEKDQWSPNKDDPNGFKGAWFTICFSWLIFGFTLDFRFGDHAKENA